VIPELPEINSGFASCYPKFSNKIRVSGISGSGSSIPGSGFGLRVFCPALGVVAIAVHLAQGRWASTQSSHLRLPERPGQRWYRQPTSLPGPA
jgi:hypothetical protein